MAGCSGDPGYPRIPCTIIDVVVVTIVHLVVFEAAREGLPREIAGDARFPGERFIDVRRPAADHAPVNDHLYINVVDAKRQARRIQFVAAHGEVLNAEQFTVTVNVHFTGGWQEHRYGHQSKRIVLRLGTAFIAIADAVNAAGVQGAHAGDRLQIPGIHHSHGEAASLIVTFVHRAIQFTLLVAGTNSVEGTVKVQMVLAQRPGIVQRQVAAGVIGILIFVVIAPHRVIQHAREILSSGFPKHVGTRQNSGLHGCPVNRQLKIKGTRIE